MVHDEINTNVKNFFVMQFIFKRDWSNSLKVGKYFSDVVEVCIRSFVGVHLRICLEMLVKLESTTQNVNNCYISMPRVTCLQLNKVALSRSP